MNDTPTNLITGTIAFGTAPLPVATAITLTPGMDYVYNNQLGGGILPDTWIRHLSGKHGMIEPFVEGLKTEGVLSYGLSSYGYDMRLAPEYKVFTNINGTVVDPKNFDTGSFVERRGDTIIIPPNSFILGTTIEYVKIPRDVMVVVVGKSTIARTGVVTNVTPIEPGFEGHVTLEFSNTTPLPVKMYANEGCCQFLFFKGAAPCETSYRDRKGKYQGQTGITLPKIATE